MPLTLPTGLIPQPIPLEPLEVLSGPRVTDYRFDLFDTDENLIGTLDSVVPGGGVESHAYSSIKGSGRITVSDRGDDIDWLNVRIRPTAILSGATEVHCGMFLASAPVETWTATGRAWDVELLDKNSILDQDIVTDIDGFAVVYIAPAGTNVLGLVKTLINDAGEPTPAIGGSIKDLEYDLAWDIGTTRLKIINDVLNAAGFFSLFCDPSGQYQALPYVDPADRVPVYSTIAPFSKGDQSLMSPEWGRDRDIYAIPNRYVAVSQGDGTNPALVSIAENMDPASPYSYQNRGERWITHTEVGVEVVGQLDLDMFAVRGLVTATSVTSKMTTSHIFLPDLLINSVVRFTNPDAGIDTTASVLNTTIPFDPLALCKTELREVAL